MGLVLFKNERVNESLIKIDNPDDQVLLNEIAVQMNIQLYKIFEEDFDMNMPTKPSVIMVSSDNNTI